LLGLAVSGAITCGKRGDPLPPLRPIPAQVTDAAVRRSATRLEITFTVPSSNADGTSPPAIDRVEVFAKTQPPGGPALTAAQLVDDSANLMTRMVVRPPDAPEPVGVSPLAPASPRPGDVVTVVDRAISGLVPGTRYYAIVGVAGGGRGRRGPLSAVAAVTLDAVPGPPAGVSVTHDETRILLSWQPAADGQQFRVLQSGEMFDPAAPQAITSAPLASTTFELPVVFGRQACFAIQPLLVSGAVVVEGTASPVQCLVPTDTYPPAVPTGLQVIQDPGGVTLIWTAVTTVDLSGYVVVRGGPDGTNPQPLFTAPITATTYRDATVQPGMTYTYAVYAVDKAQPPNASAPSAPEVVTVR
jgi:hypothetical protein